MLLVLFKRFLGKRHSHHPSHLDSETPEQKVIRIQEGDLRLRNQFIIDYQPYVAKVTSRFCKRYIDPSRDDEFSVALAAFNEAINQYAPNLGGSFFSFAETVIRRRLIDYVRKEQRFSGQIPYSYFEVEDDEDNAANPIEVHQAIEQYEQEKLIEDRKSEIDDFTARLLEFGITFNDLVDASPKHADSREALFSIGKTLAEDRFLMDILLSKKMLPIKELLDKVQVSRKTLERNRKFLIAVALIYDGSYPCLRDYLHVTQSAAGGSEQE